MATDGQTRELDVREIEGPPFSDIVAALDVLGPAETLELTAGFEPVPLYEVLEARGFTHETERVTADKWHVYVRHE